MTSRHLTLLNLTALLAFLLLTAPHASAADVETANSNNFFESPDKEETEYTGRTLTFSTTAGAMFNTGGNDNATWFGKIHPVNGSIDFRLSYYFKTSWGVYADLAITPDMEDWTFPDSENYGYGSQCAFDEGLNCGLSLGIGAVYRKVFSKRWQVYGRFGFTTMAGPRQRQNNYFYGYTDEVFDENNPYPEPSSFNEVHFNGSTFGIELGTGAYFSINRIFGIICDIKYRQRIGSRAIVRWEHFEGEEGPHGYRYKEVEHINHRSKSWGNFLTLSLGVQLKFDFHRKPKAKNSRTLLKARLYERGCSVLSA